MPNIQFILNRQLVDTEVNSSLTLLDYVRDHQDLPGTKIGCREGDCGACTVLIGCLLPTGEMRYQNVTSCLTPLGNVHGMHVVTVEGINMTDLSPVQQAIVDRGGTQCGFCTVGFVMSLTNYCLSYSEGHLTAIDAIDGNICRCTGYKSIEKAALDIEKMLLSMPQEDWMNQLVINEMVPAYFQDIAPRLKNLEMFQSVGEKPIGGGTDLYVQQYDHLIDLDLTFLARKERDYIRQTRDEIVVGGNTTATNFANSPVIQQYIPEISRFFRLIASTPIKNIATLAGNIVNASPIADFVNILLAFDAKLVLSSGREVELAEFYHGYKELDLEDGEIIDEIRFSLTVEDRFNFEKVSKRTHLDIASVNTSALIRTDGDRITHCRISAGGVAPYPLLLQRTSKYLEGQQVDPETIAKVLELADEEISPISDIRGSAKYKRLLLRQLILAHVMELFPSRSNTILQEVLL